MVLKAYSIRDAKGEFYHNPFYKYTHGEAEREFQLLVNDEKALIHQFPEDFDLYFLGEYDNVRGIFDSLTTPQHIVKAVQFKRGKTEATAE